MGFFIGHEACAILLGELSLVLIYTPKEAHSRILVTGGSVIA